MLKCTFFWLIECLQVNQMYIKWTFEVVFIGRLHFTATLFVTIVSDNVHF